MTYAREQSRHLPTPRGGGCGGLGRGRWHPGGAAPQKGWVPRSPAVVHSWQALAAGRAPAVPRVAQGIALPLRPT